MRSYASPDTPELSLRRSLLEDLTSTAPLENIWQGYTNSDAYEQFTLGTLYRLKDQAQPTWDPENIDPIESRRLVKKALAIQGIGTFSQMLRQSELQPEFDSLRRTIKTVRETIRFSLNDSPSGLSVDRGRPKRSSSQEGLDLGSPVAEFRLDLSPKSGFDPQIIFTESLRLRYNLLRDISMLEYNIQF
ncbi:MAG: hypothetical protein KDD60_03120 [Bdellovibrionales bacterium]|nr:hypothetical protein [Bdellovibrionales bacterium]